MSVVRRTARALGACALAMLASCGWQVGALRPEGADSVGVEVFATTERVLERDVEPALHRELSRATSDLSGLPLARVDEADLVVRGRITEYRRRSGIRSPDNELLETGLRLNVSAELVDRRDGRVLRTAPARLWTGYALLGPGQEDEARARSLRHLAETLTLELFRPEPLPPSDAAEAADDGAGSAPADGAAVGEPSARG